MKALVTGGCGFIGSNLVRKLLLQGHQVTVLDNLSTGKKENLPVDPNLKFIWTDIRNHIPGATGTPYNEHVDVIFHLAALARIQPSFHNPLETYSTNSMATMRVLEYARKYDARVIYAGSSSFYHDIYANPYTYTKWLGEEHCQLYRKLYGVKAMIARFFNVYGPNQIEDGAYATVIGIFEKQRREGKLLTVTGTGEQRRDFTHVEDICDGLLLLAEGAYPGIFNFGTGRNHSINEVARMFEPEGIKYLPKRPGEAETTLADIRRAEQELGWKPKWRLEDYVAGFLKTLR